MISPAAEIDGNEKGTAGRLGREGGSRTAGGNGRPSSRLGDGTSHLAWTKPSGSGGQGRQSGKGGMNAMVEFTEPTRASPRRIEKISFFMVLTPR
jgi:hypothetical protein